ncbi:DUF4345 family protein [Blastopirellula sp. JC732]|uniref:DUF4345 family protein n=1 Tax=Blastopirellula sediminis TaxID=2894196 RepID=A0A9X1MKW0_9BACT|nr:DUF4345 family protein [Blastopirellula sediminis]MCC9607828.1 DUF4345 family protein [Blastopirellula sediminis]MCC9627379.1 DUF4345 family protein [Blastopirellula sediminis]
MVTIIARVFLALVGCLYVGLGIWCAVAPQKTSAVVGFTLQPGSGQSEFLTVYGGLEVGLGLLFLWPLYRSGDFEFPLAACLMVHACLVLFRTIGFFSFSGMSSTTYNVAAAEWVIFLTSAVLFFWKR